MRAAVVDDLARPLQLGILQLRLQMLRVADDAIQGCSQLMRHGGQKLALVAVGHIGLLAAGIKLLVNTLGTPQQVQRCAGKQADDQADDSTELEVGEVTRLKLLERLRAGHAGQHQQWKFFQVFVGVQTGYAVKQLV